MSSVLDFEINRQDGMRPLTFIYAIRTAIDSLTPTDTDNIVVNRSELEDNLIHLWFSDTEYNYETKFDIYDGTTVYCTKSLK